IDDERRVRGGAPRGGVRAGAHGMDRAEEEHRGGDAAEGEQRAHAVADDVLRDERHEARRDHEEAPATAARAACGALAAAAAAVAVTAGVPASSRRPFSRCRTRAATSAACASCVTMTSVR